MTNIRLKILGYIDNAFSEAGKFFDWSLDKVPELVIVPDRKTINSLKGRITEDWFVGWTKDGKIYLLSPENYEKESNHKYSDEEYYMLMKHEMCHIFLKDMVGKNIKPVWISEGIPIYVSGQNKSKKPLSRFKGFTRNQDGYTDTNALYYESGFAIELLVERFGKQKLLDMIKGLTSVHTEKYFSNYFRSVYGFDPTIENFNKLLTQS